MMTLSQLLSRHRAVEGSDLLTSTTRYTEPRNSSLDHIAIVDEEGMQEEEGDNKKEKEEKDKEEDKEEKDKEEDKGEKDKEEDKGEKAYEKMYAEPLFSFVRDTLKDNGSKDNKNKKENRMEYYSEFVSKALDTILYNFRLSDITEEVNILNIR